MTEQRTQQTPTPERQEQVPNARREFAKKGALAAITGVCSGAARAIVVALLGDDA